MTESTVFTGSLSFLKELKKRSFKSAEGIVQFTTAEELTEKYLEECLFEFPIIVLNPQGLGMRIPPYNDYQDLVQPIGENHMFEVVDSAKQVHIYLTCQKFVNHMKKEASKRKKILNLISCECSALPLGNEIEPPEIVRKIDFVRKYADHPDFQRLSLRSVEKYCLISGKDSFTDFHIDFSGTSVWYHIVKGTKDFYLIKPTEANLSLYWKWNDSRNRRTTFFADQVENCYKITLSANSTLLLPCGWIHAVLTTEDSLVYGGNYLHHFNIPRQLDIYIQEKKHKVPSKQIYPYYVDLQWFIADIMCKEVDVLLSSEILPPIYIISGLKVLKHTLRKWRHDSAFSSTFRNPDELLKRLGAVLRRINKMENKQSPKEPRRESSRLKRKRNFDDYITDNTTRRRSESAESDIINLPSTSTEGQTLRTDSDVQHSLENLSLPDLLKASRLPPLNYNYREGSRHITSPVNTDEEELALLAHCKPVRIMVERLTLRDIYKLQNKMNVTTGDAESDQTTRNRSNSPLAGSNSQDEDNRSGPDTRSRSNSPLIGFPQVVEEGEEDVTRSFSVNSCLPSTSSAPQCSYASTSGVGNTNVAGCNENSVGSMSESFDSDRTIYPGNFEPQTMERMSNEAISNNDSNGGSIDLSPPNEQNPESPRPHSAISDNNIYQENRERETMASRAESTPGPSSPLPNNEDPDEIEMHYAVIESNQPLGFSVYAPVYEEEENRAESTSAGSEEEENTSGSDSDVEQVVSRRSDSDNEETLVSTRRPDSDSEPRTLRGVGNSDEQQKDSAETDSDNEQAASESENEPVMGSEAGSEEEHESVLVERESSNPASRPASRDERPTSRRNIRVLTPQELIGPDPASRLLPFTPQSPADPYNTPSSTISLQTLQVEELLLRLKNIIDTNYRAELINILNNSVIFQPQRTAEAPMAPVSRNLPSQDRTNLSSKLVKYSCGHYACGTTGILSTLEHDPGLCSECLEKAKRAPRIEPEIIDILSSSDEEADVISQDNDFVYLAVSSTENEDADDTLWSPSSRHLKVDPKQSRPAREGIKKRNFSGASTSEVSRPSSTGSPTEQNSQSHREYCHKVVYKKKGKKEEKSSRTDESQDALAQPSTSGCTKMTGIRKKRAKPASKKSPDKANTECRRKRKLTTAKQRLGKILKLF